MPIIVFKQEESSCYPHLQEAGLKWWFGTVFLKTQAHSGTAGRKGVFPGRGMWQRHWSNRIAQQTSVGIPHTWANLTESPRGEETAWVKFYPSLWLSTRKAHPIALKFFPPAAQRYLALFCLFLEVYVTCSALPHQNICFLSRLSHLTFTQAFKVRAAIYGCPHNWT